MMPNETAAIQSQLRAVEVELGEVVRLQREANKRLGRLEGRVFEIEIWRARLQGAAGASKVVWMIAGGAVTAFIIELIRNL